jgi:salicylate hydroxylase
LCEIKGKSDEQKETQSTKSEKARQHFRKCIRKEDFLMAELRVAIIGGGIGGLSAAVALLSRGAQVQVYEQAPRLDEVGAGVALQPNGLRVLERLSVGDRVAGVGARFTEWRFCQMDGTVVSRETFTTLGLHRADLVTALVASLPQDVVHTGHRCVGFAQDDRRAVVTFDNGVSVEADVVVAADGIHSTLQRYVVEPREPVFSGVVAYRGVMPARRVPEWPEGAFRVWAGYGKHLLVFPVRGGELLNYVGFVPADEQMRESWSASGDPAQLSAEFAEGWDPMVGRILSQVETTFRWGLYDREPLPRWSQGRLTLLGDAAHPMLPHMGQGANQAIEDGMALATLLRGASAADVPDVLVRYQVLRRERTAQFQLGSRINGVRLDSEEPVTFGLPWVHDYDVEAEACC